MQRAILENKLRNLVVMAASVFALAACGGGGGGGDHGGGGGLGSGTFTRTANNTGSGDQVPFGVNAFGDVTAQFLYLAGDIGGSSGRITALRFRKAVTTPAPITCPNTTIRLGHSSAATLVATFATNTNVGTPVVVLNDATVSVPAADGDSFEIPLTTPFDYNGVDNLVLQVNRTTTCSGGVVFGVDTFGFASRRAFSSATDTTPGTAQNDTITATTIADRVPWMQFVFAGGDNKLTFGGAGNNTWPFDNNLGGLRIQNLYLASEINGSGPITGIAYQLNVASVAGTYTYSLRLGHSTLAALTSTFANNYSGSLTTVANAVTNFTIPVGIPAGEWIWVPIPDGTFTYNGTDNLLVEVSTTAGTVGNTLRTAAIAGRRVWANGAATATGNVDDITAYHIALRFHGDRMVKLTANTTSANTVFNNLFSTLTLLSKTDLGTAGNITSVGCRLRTASVAADYANFRVVLGHATGATLSGTAATDFVSQNTVFNGTVSVPAGLLAGDWVDIPLSAPFAYDGKSNLIVWMGNAGPGPGTATVNNCRGEFNVARYPSGVGTSQTGVGSATYALLDAAMDVRMTIQK